MKERKAVTEIVSTILIIFIVSAAGSYLFSYSTHLFQETQDQQLRQTELRTNRIMERFRVLSVIEDAETDFLNVTVYNYGANDVAVSDIYLNGVHVASFSYASQVINSGRYRTIGFTSPIEVASGTAYRVTIVSERGVTKTYEWEA